MQITIEPNKLSAEQLTAIINFLSTYPKHATTTHRERMEIDISANTDNAVNNINKLQDAVRAAATTVDEASAAFGGVQLGHTASFDNVDHKIVAIATSSNTVVAPGTVVTDRNGFPWDNRIHSSNKQTTADGVWRKRRGIDDATVAAVEAELRQVMGAPAAAPLPQNSLVVSNPCGSPATPANRRYAANSGSFT